MQTKIIYINSRTRQSGNDSNFSHSVDLSNFNPDHVVVLSAMIPKSYYLIQDTKNTFTLTENGTDATITLTPGTYTRATFKTSLQTLLNSDSPNGWTYAISIPAITAVDTGKYTFTVSGNGGLQPSFTFLTTNNLFEIMGFLTGTTNTFVGDTMDSTNVIKLQIEDTLYIRSDIVGERANNILQEVHSYGADYDSIVFQNPAPDYYKKQINSHSNNIYNFYLTNEDGVAMDLNGLNWTMTLCFFVSDNTNKLLQEYIKFKVKK